MMNKKERAHFVQKTLDLYFPHPTIPLKHKDHFTLLVAVILSARSTDAMVNFVTPKLFALADTPQKMIDLPLTTLQKIIQPCGLSPQKAKRLQALSQILLDKYRGSVPKSFEELEELPGVGHKTASVVMAGAFHIPAFPIDTHIFRSAHRWGLSSGKTVAKVEEDLKKLFPRKSWIKLHLQIIYFARSYCKARGHTNASCPLCSFLNVSS